MDFIVDILSTPIFIYLVPVLLLLLGATAKVAIEKKGWRLISLCLGIEINLAALADCLLHMHESLVTMLKQKKYTDSHDIKILICTFAVVIISVVLHGFLVTWHQSCENDEPDPKIFSRAWWRERSREFFLLFLLGNIAAGAILIFEERFLWDWVVK